MSSTENATSKILRHRRNRALSPGRLGAYLFIVVIAIVTLSPIAYALSGSFKSLPDLINSGARLIPKVFAWSNYSTAWDQANFARSLRNSFVVTGSTVIVGTLAASMCGFVLARKLLIGQKMWISLMGAAIFLGAGTATLYPRYVIAQQLGLANLAGVVILQLAEIMILTTFLVQAFCRDLGTEVEEAARLDGCGLFRTYWYVGLPMMRPILTTVAVLTFQWSWNSFQVPLVFTLPRPSLQTVTVAVFALKSSGGEAFGEYTILLAGAVLALLPILIVYVFAQRYFMEGLTEGALKG